jgi:hypothetical protein
MRAAGRSGAPLPFAPTDQLSASGLRNLKVRRPRRLRTRRRLSIIRSMVRDVLTPEDGVPSEWIGDRNVLEIAESLGVVLPADIPARFSRTGWTAEGHAEDRRCPECDGGLFVCRKPYRENAGKLMRYWAFICTHCGSAWQRNQIGRPPTKDGDDVATNSADGRAFPRPMLSPHELSARAIDLVAAWSQGVTMPSRGSDYHVESPVHGRLRVHARSRRSKSLWFFTVLDPEADRYDAAVLIEFDPDDNIAAAWKLPAKAVKAGATNRTTRGGRRFLKLPVGGDWTVSAPLIDLPRRRATAEETITVGAQQRSADPTAQTAEARPRRQPHVCPVCGGTMFVRAGFYPERPRDTRCRACTTGVVWEPPADS